MTNQINIFKLRILNALLFILLIFIQYSTVFSLKIIHANPMLPLALLVCTCIFASELTSAFTGLLIGILIDGFAHTPSGFNAILLFILGLAVSLAVRHLFNNNIFSAIALCAICTLLYLLLRWVFCVAFYLSLTENLTCLMQTVLPSVLYTSVFCVPFYYLEKALYQKFYK